ncbi:hypothetical protein Tsubulata_011072, partial [Turnera subulata]
PKLNGEVTKEQIPVIDLSVSSPIDEKELVTKIGEACKKWGFFQVINHGVPLELRQRAERAAKEFFDQSMEEKKKVERDQVIPMGYSNGADRTKKKVMEWKEVFDFWVVDPTVMPASDDLADEELMTMTNQWPQYPPKFRDICQEYNREVEKLAFKLLELVSLSLGLPGDQFNGYFKDQTSFTRLNHYPPCPAPHLALGVSKHQDGTILTVLAQDDVGGLEVSRRSDGEWIPVKPIPNAFVINVGTCMQDFTNELYWSAEHRVVVNSEKERFSISFLLFPSHYVQIKALDEFVSEENPAKCKPIIWGKLFARRNRDLKKRDHTTSTGDSFKESIMVPLELIRKLQKNSLIRQLMKKGESHIATYLSVSSNLAMGDIDPAFVQGAEYRPKLNNKVSEEEEIPVIDLSASSTGDTQELVARIGEACKKWGFFQVINHGVPLELRQKVERAAKQFFDLPMEEKWKVKRDEVNPMGYHDSEHTKNVRDWKEVFDFLVVDPTLIPASEDPADQDLRTLTNQWPQYPPEFRELCQEYNRQVEKLAFKLLELISLSLGLPADQFHGYFKEQISFSRFNHYPPCPAPHLALGVGRHKDGGALTVLAQDDVGGLEISRRSDGEWIPVRPIPNTFIINIGNCMQVWTNDLYWSAEHRVVVNSEKERFSIPFFFFPSRYAQIKPLDELVSEQNPGRYKEFNWGKFFASRNRSDFKKRDVENVQIDHFKASD